MLRLIRKESRQLLPVACLWLALVALGHVIRFMTERVDEMTFSTWCDGYCDFGGDTTTVIISALIALVTAYSLFPREHDDATIDFLRALPISRRSVFIAKVLAAWLILCFISILSFGLDALILAINPESIGGQFYPQVWSTLLWRDCLLAFILLSHGVLLSWFRTVGLVIYVIYLVLLMYLESTLGTSGIWSIFSLVTNEYDGSRLLVNTRGLLIHTGVALACLWIAYRLWDRTESSASGGQQETRGMRVFRGLLSVFGFLGLTLVLLYQVGAGTGASIGSTELRVASTEHYRFVYPASKETTVQYILEHAENDYAELGQMLGVTSLPSIRVDLSAQSEHAAGLATWKKIKMDLDQFEADVSQRRVLSHEATHVLQAVESDRAMARYSAAAKFFIEGMAQYTSFEIVPERERREANWRLAAVSWKRQNIEFGNLIDEASFIESFDPELHYSLGDLWTSAYVTVCGERALGDFLRAAGREDAVRDLPASIFWRDTTRHINCDLDTVNETWRTQMQALYDTVDADRFPEYTDIVISRDEATGQAVIDASLVSYQPDDAGSLQKDDAGAAVVNVPERFAVRVGAPSTRLAIGNDAIYRGQLVEDDNGLRVRFRLPASAVSGTRFRYQLGYIPSKGSRYYYEAWKRGSL